MNTSGLYGDIDDWLLDQHDRKISTMHMTKPQNKLTPKCLLQIWKCGAETARKTIEASTCMHYRNINQGLIKQFRPSRNFM